MKLLLDEHYTPVVAEQLRSRGHDVVAATELPQLRHQPDDVVVAWAVAEHRAVVTENAVDFVPLHDDYVSRGLTHWGIILTSRHRFPRNVSAIGRIVNALDELLRTLPEEDALQAVSQWL